MRYVLDAVLVLSLISLPAVSPAITSFDVPSEYVPLPDRFRAVVRLSMTRTDGTVATCTGSVIRGNRVLTAAHCVTDGDGNANVKSIDVQFRGEDPSTGALTTSTMTAKSYHFRPEWTGKVTTSGADVAVISLPAAPPAGVGFLDPVSSRIEPADDFPPAVLIAGYGRSGKGGVDPAITDRPLRVGINHYNVLPSDFFSASFSAAGEYSAFDFDNYNGLYNRLGEPGWVTLPGGVQAIPQIDWNLDGSSVNGEVMIAPGDSGGPSIIDGFFITGIHSWVYDGSVGGDVPIPLDNLSSDFDATFGTIGGDVDVSRYADWIATVGMTPVPLPGAALLMISAIAIVGFGGVRRRRVESK